MLDADGREVLVPFVAALVPDGRRAGGRLVVADRPGPGQRRAGAEPRMTHRRRHDLPRLPRPLELSLPGKARESGLLDLRVHDLRDWTHDRHRTVDDTPYGGGAGMVMKPEPWGEALDAVVPAGSTPGPTSGPDATLVVPTPAGEPFRQALAAELATREHLVFACGRYEGIDQRVLDDARDRMEVREVSLGDYVLNGGEVAALVVIEAVVRLLPGLHGQPRVADRGVARPDGDGRAAGVPRLHQAAELARPRRPRRAALRRPRPDRGLAARPVPAAYGRAPTRPAARRRAVGDLVESARCSRATRESC